MYDVFFMFPLQQKQRGLTLVELMVVIMIIAIIASVAIPYFQSILAKQEMRNVSFLVPHILLNARHEAFIRRQDVVVCPSVDGIACTNHSLWQHYVITFVDSNRNRQKDEHELLLSNHYLNLKYATLTRLGARHANYIMYKQSNALPQGSQGSFMYCSLIEQTLNRRIVLNAMGLTRIESSATCS